jgi:thiol-disulfide isomerase/thioredoxin
VSRRAGAAVAAAAALLALLGGSLTACAGGHTDVSAPGRAKVPVDTPQLRHLKATTDVPGCRPGPGGGPLPALTLACLGGGRSVDLSSLTGPLIINLWASNCGPCREEMPAIEAFHEEYGARVPVLGIDYQDLQPAAALDLARRSGVSYPLVADPGGDVNADSPFPVIRGIPYFVFVTAGGDVTAVPGGISSADDLVALVRAHLGVHL